MQLVTVKKLERAFDLIYKLLSEFDGFMVKPKANFIGEPFLGRYGLYENEFEEFCSKMDIINNLGSDFTVYEIANKLGIDMIELKKYFTMFIEKKLMYYETI